MIHFPTNAPRLDIFQANRRAYISDTARIISALQESFASTVEGIKTAGFLHGRALHIRSGFC